MSIEEEKRPTKDKTPMTRKDLFRTYLFMFAGTRAEQQIEMNSMPETVEEAAALAIAAYEGAKSAGPGDFHDFNKALDSVLRGLPTEKEPK